MFSKPNRYGKNPPYHSGTPRTAWILFTTAERYQKLHVSLRGSELDAAELYAVWMTGSGITQAAPKHHQRIHTCLSDMEVFRRIMQGLLTIQFMLPTIVIERGGINHFVGCTNASNHENLKTDGCQKKNIINM
jgi:hypothetical protein